MDPKRVIGEWLDRYERTAGVDAAQMQALRDQIGRMSPQQLERFAAWLEERHKSEEPSGSSLRGFGLQPAAEPKRRMSLPGLRFIRAGM